MSKVVRIVTIDDDTEFIELIDRALIARGYVMMYANTGSEGIRLTRLMHPDLV
jgi:ActR/RegA family two-component response regulator